MQHSVGPKWRRATVSHLERLSYFLDRVFPSRTASSSTKVRQISAASLAVAAAAVAAALSMHTAGSELQIANGDGRRRYETGMTRNHGRLRRRRRMRQQKNLISQMGGGSRQRQRGREALARVTGSCTFIRAAAYVHSIPIPEMKTA